MTKDTKAAEEEVREPEKDKPAIRVLDLAIAEGAIAKVLNILFTNTFGNQANKKIYALQKEIQPYVEEYSHLRKKIAEDPKNVDGEKFSKEGMKHFGALNETTGMKLVEFKTELPIKVQFLDCFSSNDRIILESIGIAEFED